MGVSSVYLIFSSSIVPYVSSSRFTGHFSLAVSSETLRGNSGSEYTRRVNLLQCFSDKPGHRIQNAIWSVHTCICICMPSAISANFLSYVVLSGTEQAADLCALFMLLKVYGNITTVAGMTPLK
jgi:hypothetical protein